MQGRQDINDTFDISLECRLRDQMGHTYDSSHPSILQSVKKCAYIKMINVPSMLDIQGTLPDPTDESLSMCLMDHATLNVLSTFMKKTRLGADLTSKDVDDNATFARGADEEEEDTISLNDEEEHQILAQSE